MIKLKNRFIGPKKIKSGEATARQTYLGKPIYSISFTDGTQKEYPEEMLEYIVTPKGIDLTELQTITIEPIAKKIMAIFAESEITITDASYISINIVPNTLQMNVNKVYSNMWGKENHEVTVRDVNDELLKGNVR